MVARSVLRGKLLQGFYLTVGKTMGFKKASSGIDSSELINIGMGSKTTSHIGRLILNVFISYHTNLRALYTLWNLLILFTTHIQASRFFLKLDNFRKFFLSPKYTFLMIVEVWFFRLFQWESSLLHLRLRLLSLQFLLLGCSWWEFRLFWFF